MARAEKEQVVAELTRRLKQSSGVIATDYQGLSVKAITELRRSLRAAGGEYRVVKNTLLRRAADAAGMPELRAVLTGPTAVCFVGEEPSAVAKALLAFARQAGLPQVRAAMMGGRLYPAEAVQELATLPGRDGVMAMVLGALQAPLAALIATLQAPVAQLIATLEAVAQQRQASAP